MGQPKDPSGTVEARDLTRRYGDRTAVDHVSFVVPRGEIFGFLGPNGAGKSTTAQMLTGFLAPSEGSALIAGIDMADDPTVARESIGVVPEEANAYADLSVWQNVMLMAELHGIPRKQRIASGASLLDMFGLGDRHSQKGRELSKGLRQRLMICAALVSEPHILFLDEPTSGLDVASARLIREMITRLNRERAMTVFITTHNMEEAANLCHRVAIIDRGKLAAVGTPESLKGVVEARRSVEVRFDGALGVAKDLVGDLPVTEIIPLPDGFKAYSPASGQLAQEIAARSKVSGLKLAVLTTQAPTLEDVFLHITAHGLQQKRDGR